MVIRYIVNPFTRDLDAIQGFPASFVGTITGNSGGPISPDASNNINIVGSSGITVTGTPLTSTLTITHDNYLEGTGQTISAPSVINLIVFPLGAVAGVYQFSIDIAGYDLTNPAGIGVHEIVTVRTTGIAASIVDTVDTILNSEAPIVPALTYSRVAGNNFIVSAYGSPLQTINWRAVATYVKVV